jgi:hypothetical protein
MAAAPATTTPAPEASAAIAPAVAATLASKILKQGKPAAHLPSTEKVLGKPGRYRVKHGSVTVGYDVGTADRPGTGERTTAWAGAHISLTAEEAGPLLAADTVERLEEQ